VGDSLSPELGRLEGMKRLAVPKVERCLRNWAFTYMGPVDGHNLEELIATFQQAHQHGSVLVHVATVKGSRRSRERPTMLNHPSSHHWQSHPSSKPSPRIPKVFAHTLVKLAENNPKIITAAMATGTGLDKLQAAPTIYRCWHC